MRRITNTLAAFFVVSIFVSAALAQQFVQVEPGRYEIEIASTGKVLDLRREDMRSVQQFYRGNVRNQQWDIESAGGNSYYIRSAENGAYLSVESAREGGRVVATGGRRGGDTWRFMDLGNGNLMIVHRSGMTLDLREGNPNDGAPIQVWSQARNANQQFRLARVYTDAASDFSRTEYNEGYQAGVNDRTANLNRNYRRHRGLYNRNTESEFERGYNAGYESGRYDGGYNDDLGGMNQNERRAYDEGYQLGQQDARSGYAANYSRHSNRYNRRQESFFRRGYEEGFNSAGYNNDQFDLSRLNANERRAYDDGYRLGRQDARSGYSLDYRRYSNRYNNRQEAFFRRGYEVGYNRGR